MSVRSARTDCKSIVVIRGVVIRAEVMVRNADSLSVNFYLCTINRKLRETLRIVKKKDRDGELLC